MDTFSFPPSFYHSTNPVFSGTKKQQTKDLPPLIFQPPLSLLKPPKGDKDKDPGFLSSAFQVQQTSENPNKRALL